MNLFLNGLAALGLVLSLGIASAPDALAKAHDQGAPNNDETTVDEPGSSVNSTAEAFSPDNASIPDNIGSGSRPSDVPDDPSGGAGPSSNGRGGDKP